jgi:hypothetical protein
MKKTIASALIALITTSSALATPEVRDLDVNTVHALGRLSYCPKEFSKMVKAGKSWIGASQHIQDLNTGSFTYKFGVYSREGWTSTKKVGSIVVEAIRTVGGPSDKSPFKITCSIEKD